MDNHMRSPAAFLLYGLTFFLVVGDRGPPDWDFGAVQDTPGKSLYSTAGGQSGAPEQIDGSTWRAGPRRGRPKGGT